MDIRVAILRVLHEVQADPLRVARVQLLHDDEDDDLLLLHNLRGLQILLGLLGRFAMDDIKRRLSGSGDDSEPVLELGVEGMTCGGCVSRLTGLLEGVEGVQHVEVILKPGQARVFGTPEPGRVEEVIRNAGFHTA